MQENQDKNHTEEFKLLQIKKANLDKDGNPDFKMPTHIDETRIQVLIRLENNHSKFPGKLNIWQ